MTTSSVPMLGQRGTKVNTIAKYGLMVLILAVLSPILLAALKGAVAIIALLALYSGTVAATPWLSLKVTNFFMDRFIDEVWQNPVVTRRNIEAQKQKQIEEDEQDLIEINSAVTTAQRQAQDFIRKYPDEAQGWQEKIDAMVEALASKYEALNSSKLALEKYMEQTEKVDAKWQVATKFNEADKKMNKRKQRDFMMELASNEAIKAADSELDESFARMDHARRLKTDGSDRPTVKPTMQLQKGADGVYTLPIVRNTVPAGV